MDCILCRYGEIALKGKNRRLFEDRLVLNIRAALQGTDYTLKNIRGRILIFTKDPAALEKLKTVFGLVSISPATTTESNSDSITSTTLNYTAEHKADAKTFRITTNRVNKEFPKSSNEMDIQLGAAVAEKHNLKVNLTQSDIDLNIEIHDQTFIFHKKLPCFGGLPVGISGNVLCLLEKPADIAAAWLMARRGCRVFIAKLSNENISILDSYSHGAPIETAEMSSLSEIDSLCEKHACKAAVTGDTFEEFNPDRFSQIKSTILTPLIGHDQTQLNTLLTRINNITP
jgi:adenylyl- and sulfurtransferase ThiI